MKWVKVAIGAVIAIISVGIIATSVYNMTQSKEYERQVDLTVYTDDSVDITIDDLNFIYEYYAFFVSYTLTPETVNGTLYGSPTTITNVSIEMYNSDVWLQIIANHSRIIISEGGIIVENPVYTGSFTPDDDFTISLHFEVTQPPQLTGINATLILLAPLIFAGGVLAYLLNKQNY